MHTNQLAREQSPYLLQHAHNPVDWRPWSEAAFQQARLQDRPIFLSVGYSTCHWCHVMERESFEDEETAALLNRFFVPVKVDREERPDVDRLYMTFVQATTGGGGWPMSVWLTPHLKPFFGGTYFPRPDFCRLLERIAETWLNQRERILESARRVLEQLERASALPSGPAALDEAVISSGFFVFRRSFDPVHGGFGGAPKFPRPVILNFLLAYHRRTGNPEALEMALTTLRAMARGGLHDHLGGGFHRYSVDERWQTPHFEKMLYDQAQLALSYLEAFEITGDDFHAGIARRTLDYVLRDLTDERGGFYSAEDADSAPDPAQPHLTEEGAFYQWTSAELERLLRRPAPTELCDLPEEDRQTLLQARSRRPRPHRDDKILTAWNGLMISALTRSARVLGEARYLDAARRAADFLCANLWTQAGLQRRWRQEQAAIPAFLDDYAFFTQGLLDLHQAGGAPRHLELALQLTDIQLALFQDLQHSGFFSTPEGQSDLILRLKDDYDGAEPSGNSVAVSNLLRLAQLTGRREYRDAAERTLRAFSRRLAAAPETLPEMLAAACRWLSHNE